MPKGRTKRGRSFETNLGDSKKYEGTEMGTARGTPKAGKGAEKNRSSQEEEGCQNETVG